VSSLKARQPQIKFYL